MKKTHPTPSVNESATAVAEATPEITDPRDRPLTQSELDEMFGITTTQSGTKAQSTPPTPSSTPASLAEPDSVYQHTAVESHNPHAEGAPAWDFTPDFTDEVTGNPTPPRTDPQVWMSWRWAVSQMDLTPEEMDNLVQGLQALVKRKDLLLAIHKLAHHSLAAQQDLVTELTRTASGRPQTLSERSFAGARSIATIMWNDRVKPLAAHYARIPAVAQQRENPLTPEVQGLFDSIPTIMGKGAQR